MFVDTNGGKGNIPVLEEKHVCSYFSTYYQQQIKDTTRVNQWKRDFDSLVVANAVPAFNSIRLGADHTQGMAVNRPTPFACVADNDLAVGMLVEHLTKSPIWPNAPYLFWKMTPGTVPTTWTPTAPTRSSSART